MSAQSFSISAQNYIASQASKINFVFNALNLGASGVSEVGMASGIAREITNAPQAAFLTVLEKDAGTALFTDQLLESNSDLTTSYNDILAQGGVNDDTDGISGLFSDPTLDNLRRNASQNISAVEGNGRTARATCYFLLCVRSGVLLPGKKIVPERIRENRDGYEVALISADRSWDYGHLDFAEMEEYLAGLLQGQLEDTD